MTSRYGRYIIWSFLSVIILLLTERVEATEPYRTVRVGYGALPGYHEQTREGERSGYGYDYLQHIVMRANWHCEYIGYDKSWADLLVMLERGEIDLLSCVNKTPEREKKFDFSEKPVGLSYVNVTIKAEDTRFSPSDYSTWNGMRVGMVSENQINDEFESWAKEKKFNYTLVPFSTDIMCQEALQAGKIDAMVSINFRRMNNELLLERFAPEPVYFAVRKGNSELLSELNRIQNSLDHENPILTSELVQRYYSKHFITFLGKNEREFIKSAKREGKVFRAILAPERYPLVFYQGGRLQGMQYELIHKIITNNGLDIQIIPCRSYSEYEQLLQTGNYDIILDAKYSYSKAEKAGVLLSNIYFSTPVSILRRNHELTPLKKIGLLDNSLLAVELYQKNMVSSSSFIYFQSIDDLVDAVKQKKVDAAYLNTRSCNEIMRLDLSHDLSSKLLHGPRISYAMGVKSSAPRELLAILNYSISTVPIAEINDSMVNYEFSPDLKFNVLTWIKINPLTSVGVLLLLLMIVMMAFLYVLFTHRQRYRNAKILKNLPVRFLAFDRNGRILQISSGNKAWFPQEISIHTVSQLPIPEVNNWILSAAQKVFQTGETQSFDFRDSGRGRSGHLIRLEKSVFGQDAVLWISLDTTELQGAKDQAEDLACRMRLKLQSIGDAVMVTDEAGCITLMNPAAEKFCGISQEESIGRKHEEIFNIVNYETGVVVASPVWTALKTGKVVELANHTDLISCDGTRRHIADSVAPIPGKDGVTTGAILVFRDVTEEYNKRNQLREMNQNFQITAQMSHVTLFHLNPKTMAISSWMPLDDFIMVKDGYVLPFKEWMYPEEIPKFEEYIAKVVRGENQVDSFSHRTIIDGQDHYVRSFLRKISPTSDVLIGVMQDITTYVKQENLLAQTKKMWGLIGDTLPVHLFVLNVDDNFRYVMVNRSFAALTGKSVKAIIGKNCREIYSREEEWKTFEQNDREIAKSGQMRDFEEIILNASGEEVNLHTLISPVPGPNGERLLVGISIDITSEKNRENQLRISNEQLQKYVEQDQFQKQCLTELLIATDFNSAFEKIAAMLGKCLQSTIINLIKYHQDGRSRLSSELKWNKEDWEQPGQIPNETFYEDEYPSFFNELKQGHTVHIVREDLGNSLSGLLRPWQKEFVEYFHQTSCREILCVPIIFHNVFWGSINSGNYHSDSLFGEAGNRIMVSAARMLELLLTRNEMSEELVRSEHEKRLLLDILPLPVVVLSRESRILLHNQDFTKLVASKKTDLTGEFCLHRICGEQDCSEDNCPLRLSLFHKLPQNLEKVIRNRDYLVKTMPVPDSSGINRVFVVFIDLTEMKDRQRLLQEAMEEAKKAEKAKTYFLATLSHEIRTPLNAVIGFTEILKDNNLPEQERQDYLKDIAVSGNALLDLINDILDISKLESGQMTFSNTEIQFPMLVDEICTIFLAKLQEKKLQCLVEIKSMPHLVTDKQRIRQILFNLIGNAVKFTTTGTITISGEFCPESSDTGRLSFSVKDTGCGIKQEEQESIFRPFVQSTTQRGTQAANNGTGLGLAIVRRMLERMNGSISLISEFGKGSLFTVVIHKVPFVISPDMPQTQTPSFGLCCQLNVQPRILLVDDVSMNLKVVKAMCDKIGLANVKIAGSGFEALELMEKEPFDMVITDMWMPDMDGVALAQRIRDEKKFDHIQIFALTADVEAQTTFDLHNFSAILLKPVTFEKIVKVVNSYTSTEYSCNVDQTPEMKESEEKKQ